MGDLNFYLTAILFASLGYGLCYLAMAKPGRDPLDNHLTQENFSRMLKASEHVNHE